MKGILGRKLGMTQVFTAEGDLIPVTVIEVQPNAVLQKKSNETDGYEALQLGYEDKKEARASKPELGHAKKAGLGPKQFIREIRSDEIVRSTPPHHRRRPHGRRTQRLGPIKP